MTTNASAGHRASAVNGRDQAGRRRQAGSSRAVAVPTVRRGLVFGCFFLVETNVLCCAVMKWDAVRSPLAKFGLPCLGDDERCPGSREEIFVTTVLLSVAAVTADAPAGSGLLAALRIPWRYYCCLNKRILWLCL
jgi:hypothetical protein